MTRSPRYGISMRVYPKSIVEFAQDFAPIGAEAVVECARDVRLWAGRIIAEKVAEGINRLDEWACDYGDSE